jgi:hypothetical protein
MESVEDGHTVADVAPCREGSRIPRAVEFSAVESIQQDSFVYAVLDGDSSTAQGHRRSNRVFVARKTFYSAILDVVGLGRFGGTDGFCLDFVARVPHSDSMKAMAPFMGKTKFTQWKVSGSNVPLRWDEAIGRIAQGS